MEGSAIYQAVGDFAHNNGLKFIGDPEGLSPIAQIRRTLNMLASAMRHGTTRHLAPHPLQQSPQVKAARPLRWREGDDAFNIREMADTLVETYGRLVPEIKGIRYNGRTKRFEEDRKSTRLNSSHVKISYAVFCLKKKRTHNES